MGSHTMTGCAWFSYTYMYISYFSYTLVLSNQVAPPTGPKTIGNFVVSPCGGRLEPGQTASVEVTFTPKGKGEYKEFIQVRIDRRRGQ